MATPNFADNSAAKSLLVLTINTWNRSGPYEQRLKLLRQALRDLRPDLIALQEVVGKPHLDELLSGLAYYSEWFGNNEGGVAIAARWPQRAELWLLICLIFCTATTGGTGVVVAAPRLYDCR